MTKALCELPTERQNNTGIWVFLSTQSTLVLATVGIGRKPLDRHRLDAVLDLAQPSERSSEPTAVRMPGDEHAVRAEPGRHADRRLRAVAVGTHVLFAGPQKSPERRPPWRPDGVDQLVVEESAARSLRRRNMWWK